MNWLIPFCNSHQYSSGQLSKHARTSSHLTCITTTWLRWERVFIVNGLFGPYLHTGIRCFTVLYFPSQMLWVFCKMKARPSIGKKITTCSIATHCIAVAWNQTWTISKGCLHTGSVKTQSSSHLSNKVPSQNHFLASILYLKNFYTSFFPN